MGVLIDHVACPDCGGSDCLALHEEEDGTYNGTCWSKCRSEEGKGYKSHNHLAESYLGEELGITVNKGNSKQEKKPVRRKLGSKKDNKDKVITEKQLNYIKENSTEDGDNFRSISDKTLKRFRVRTEWNELGEVSNRYYPVTLGKDKNGIPKLVGYHKRIVLPEKDFRAVGLNSKECELFGQWLCKGNKKLVLTGGQEDTMAAWQMFDNYREERDNIAPVDFVSGTVGETSLAEQIRFNYDFIDRYDEIIIDMDDDNAGENATNSLLEVLPLHKVKIMAYGAKDANQALEDKAESEYVRAIYNARKPRISGVVSSLDLHQKILEICDIPSIPLPPILTKANEMLGGGLPLGEIVNILAGSGIGKTTIVGEFTYYWIFNSPHKIGVLSYEAVAGQYGMKILSRHLGVNLLKIVDRDEEGNIMPTKENRKRYLQREKVLYKAEELYSTDEGEERFALIDSRDEMSTVEDVKRKIVQLIKAHQVKVVIIDPITDLLDSMETTEQAAFCAWLKKMKSTGITFVLINHSRKTSSNTKSAARGGSLDEQDMMGTGALYRSGAVNIIIERDKEAEDEIERNTTKVRITKNRDGSETGKADELYYEYRAATLHNKEKWLEENGGYG